MTKALILCIEDEISLREDIALDLCEAGHEVIAVGQATEAIEVLRRCRPDLILCDIVMPGMDGHAFLAHLRATRPDLDDIPLVFLTALSSRDQMIAGRRAGADDYLTKPIDYDLLRAIIASRLERVTRLRAAQGGGAAALDRLAVGVILLDAAGGVHHANPAARDMARDAGLTLAARVGAEGDTGRKLSDLVGRLISGQDSGGALVLEAGARRVILLGRALNRRSQQDGATAMLMLGDPDRQHPLDPASLRQLFGLTPSEADVARLLAEGLRRNQIAARLGLSPTTIAFHLRNIFDKTGTHRQADLVALILSMPMIVPDA